MKIRHWLCILFLLCAVVLSFLVSCDYGPSGTGATTVPRGTGILSESLRVIDDRASGYIPYDAGTFSFADDITVAEGASYTVCADLFCMDTVPEKVVPIHDGDNMWYLLVENGSERTMYTVLIRRGKPAEITFDSGEGSACEPMTVTKELPIGVLPVPTLWGYMFDGWFYDPLCTERVSETDDLTARAGSTVTLYAGWKLDPDVKVTVTLYVGDEVWKTLSVPFASVPVLPEPSLPEDEPFIGWMDEKGYFYKADAPLTRDMTLCACTGTDVATISFRSMGGSACEDIVAHKGQPIGALPVPTRADYVFEGWYYNAACTLRVSEEDICRESMTLYAAWKLDTVSVVYLVDGTVSETQEVLRGRMTSAPTISVPVPAGRCFTGWYVSGSDTPFDFENTPIDQTTVLVARFADILYHITYTIVGDSALGINAADVINHNADVVTYTVGDPVTFARAICSGNPAYTGIWVDESGAAVTGTKGLTGDLHLTVRWRKAAYIDLDFEGLRIHYADYAGVGGKTALDGTRQGQVSIAPVKPNLYILSHYETRDGVLMLDFAQGTILLEGFKNSNNPAYIRNDGDAHGNYYCVVLDKDLTDGSQNEANYDDKKGEKQHTTDGKKFFEGVSSVYYCFSNGEPYNVGLLCYTQNNSTATGNVKLSFDFYFEAGGIFPISFYLRDGGKTYGKEFHGNRTNLAALMPNGEIVIGIDAFGNTKRLSYKDESGNTIAEKQVLGTAKAGQWNTIEFVMTLQDSGTNYSVDITLNGTKIATALNLYVGDLTWNHATMFMIFGGGRSAKAEDLPHDIVYKFDNIRLTDA